MYLLPLPGGTMNMLPRALYGDVSWKNALKNTLAHPVAKALSGGRVEDNQFFVAAIAGVPELWAETRESIREGDIIDAIKTGAVAFQGMFATKIEYSISSERKGEAEVVAVICPLISEQMSESEQALEAAVINLENAAELIRFATAAAVGRWRHGGNISLSRTPRVTVQSSADIPIFLDGERVKVGKKAEISFVPKAVNVIVPAERTG
jgi:diacylglycerol kinase family enzyme